jgi:hypothetical protein
MQEDKCFFIRRLFNTVNGMYSKYTLKSVRIYAAVVIVVASAMQLLHTVVKILRVAGGDNAIATATTVVNSI